ncbi:hypothetical protein HW555_011464, partial [Spodoptera exigua]
SRRHEDDDAVTVSINGGATIKITLKSFKKPVTLRDLWKTCMTDMKMSVVNTKARSCSVIHGVPY